MAALEHPPHIPFGSYLYHQQRQVANKINVRQLKAIILIGPSCSGKTTLGGKLAELFGPVGLQVEGDPLSRLTEDPGKILILSDFPRTMREAKRLHTGPGPKIGYDEVLVFGLWLTPKETYARLKSQGIDGTSRDCDREYRQVSILINHYRTMKRLYGIDASRQVEVIWAEICRTLEIVGLIKLAPNRG